MRQLGLILAVVIILAIGGGLTAQLISTQEQSPLPVLRQTDNPEASVLDVVPWKAEQFILMVGFILFNLVGIAVTIAVIMWFIDRGIRRSRAQAASAVTPAPDARPQERAPDK